MELVAKRSLLEELAHRLEIEVRFEPLGAQWSSAGGLCRLRERRVIMIDSRAPLVEQVGVLLDALRDQDLEGLFIPPALRRDFERRRS